MDEHKVKRTIMWLCRKCYEGIRDTPQEKYPLRKKYRIWEAGRWCRDGECALCHEWKLLTLYEMENAEAKETTARRKAYRERNGRPKKDTRARYRAWENET